MQKFTKGIFKVFAVQKLQAKTYDIWVITPWYNMVKIKTIFFSKSMMCIYQALFGIVP